MVQEPGRHAVRIPDTGWHGFIDTLVFIGVHEHEIDVERVGGFPPQCPAEHRVVKPAVFATRYDVLYYSRVVFVVTSKPQCKLVGDRNIEHGTDVELFAGGVESSRTDPDLTLELIVGFPGETEEQFKKLLDFVREVRFERVGIFKYSGEEGTPAQRMKNQIAEEVKEKRYHQLMKLLSEISEEQNQEWIGKERSVLIDAPHPEREGVWIGRSEWDAPEVDGSVLVLSNGKKIQAGDFVQVKVVEAGPYDLIGEPN